MNSWEDIISGDERLRNKRFGGGGVYLWDAIILVSSCSRRYRMEKGI